MKCEICKQGPPNGPPIYRINQPGETPARWRCVAHLTPEQDAAIDPVVRDITETIEEQKANQ
jgi:hypothetical protein